MSTTYAEGGPGRKKCDCGVFVAARTTTCPKCGHVFVSRSVEAPKRAPQPRPPVDEDGDQEPEVKRGQVLLVPAGRCPVELESSELGAVQEWAYLLKGAMSGVIVSRFMALQFLRQFFPWGSADFLAARSHLQHCRALHPDGEFRA